MPTVLAIWHSFHYELDGGHGAAAKVSCPTEIIEVIVIIIKTLPSSLGASCFSQRNLHTVTKTGPAVQAPKGSRRGNFHSENKAKTFGAASASK